MKSLFKLLVTVTLLAIAIGTPTFVSAQMPSPPGQIAPGEQPQNEAYLFSHMVEGDYGRLYYSVSLDGLYWTPLNKGKRVFEDYQGHSDICKGHDGRYYLVGNRNDDAPDINFWVSTDLITWAKYSDYTPALKTIPNYTNIIMAIGAPKLFFDHATKQYLLTWHTTHDLGKTDLPEPYWAGQRTICAVSPDLKTFSEPPRKLFDWDMATIDVIVRHIGDHYYAFIKDERYPTTDWTTGKTIRLCRADNLLGPYTKPDQPITPSFREAPTLIPSPNGKAWYLYYEQYPGIAYGLSVTDDLEKPWFQVAGSQRPDWDKFKVPTHARHGSMIPISRKEYDALVKHFGIAK